MKTEHISKDGEEIDLFKVTRHNCQAKLTIHVSVSAFIMHTRPHLQLLLVDHSQQGSINCFPCVNIILACNIRVWGNDLWNTFTSSAALILQGLLIFIYVFELLNEIIN